MNPYEVEARTQKAMRLCDVAQAHGLTARHMIIMLDDHWKQLAKAASVKPPSAETRQVTIRMMQNRENAPIQRQGVTIALLNGLDISVTVEGDAAEMRHLWGTLDNALKDGEIAGYMSVAIMQDRPTRSTKYIEEWIADIHNDSDEVEHAGHKELLPARFHL